jgi:hypothetical protein
VLRRAARKKAPADVAALLPPLEDAICEYTRQLRDTGLLPEKVVVAIKHVARTAGVADLPGGTAAPLMESIVTKCIQEYFRSE